MTIKYVSILLLLSTFAFSKSCIIKDSSWSADSEASCKDGFVHGTAKAFHTNGKLKFTGEFDHGSMIKGVVYFKNKPYYIGKISKNEMHGKGICYFKDKPESCEYYKGDRIDTIYKLRFLMRQQLLAINAMVEKQKSQSYTTDSYKQYNQNAPSSESNIGSDIGQKVLNKAVDSILDNFF